MSNSDGASSTRLARGPAMPRTPTPKPVAFATTRHLRGDLRAVGERGDHLRALPVRLGERPLRLRRPAVVQQALDVAGEDRPEPEEPDLVDQVHDHCRLIAGHVGQDDAGPIRVRP